MEPSGIYQRFRTRYAKPTPAIFLDRDGVLVEETGYLHRTEDIKIIPGVPAAIARSNHAAHPIVLVTNQAGIGRGYYGWPEFEITQSAIESALALENASLDGVWACAYHPHGKPPFNRDHEFRKPNPGMLLDASARMNLSLSQSWMVGDKILDIECALRAGLAGAILVRTGYGRQMEAHLDSLQKTSTRIFVCDDLPAASAFLLSQMQP